MGFSEQYINLLYRYRFAVVLFFSALSIVSISFGVSAFGSLPSRGFVPPLAKSTTVVRRFDQSLARPDYGLVALCTGSGGLTADDATFRSFCAAARKGLATLPKVVALISADIFPFDSRLISDDRTQALILGTIVDGTNVYTNDELKKAAYRFLSSSSNFKVIIGGEIAGSQDMKEQIFGALKIAEIATLPIIFILLFYTQGYLMASLMSWLLSLGTLCLSLGVVMGFATSYNMSNVVANAVTMLGVGLSLDFSLLIVNRFMKERQRYPLVPVTSILKEVFETSGKTVMFSALLLFASSFGGLFFSEYYLSR